MQIQEPEQTDIEVKLQYKIPGQTKLFDVNECVGLDTPARNNADPSSRWEAHQSGSRYITVTKNTILELARVVFHRAREDWANIKGAIEVTVECSPASDSDFVLTDKVRLDIIAEVRQALPGAPLEMRELDLICMTKMYSELAKDTSAINRKIERWNALRGRVYEHSFLRMASSDERAWARDWFKTNQERIARFDIDK